VRLFGESAAPELARFICHINFRLTLPKKESFDRLKRPLRSVRLCVRIIFTQRRQVRKAASTATLVRNV
jgi:hypothetical protein